jgi:hypothetical protein
LSAALMPAGAFQTPRCASVEAITPAMIPHGTNVSSCPYVFVPRFVGSVSE